MLHLQYLVAPPDLTVKFKGILGLKRQSVKRFKSVQRDWSSLKMSKSRGFAQKGRQTTIYF